jgi:cytochrome c peroxidase
MPALLRSAPSLINVGFNGLVAGAKPDPAAAPMFWDARVRGLENQVFVPMKAREEMRGDACPEREAVARAVERVEAIPEYRKLFGDAFAMREEHAVSPANLARALAAFERTVTANHAPIDRFLSGDKSALNEEQQRGLAVFEKAGCIQCHGGPMFSDYKLHFIGSPQATADDRREFRTPTLRNLRATAPYMHNGSLRTLRDVMVFYEALSDEVSETLDGGGISEPPLDPLLKHLNLIADEFPALEAFLEALNDDGYDRGIPERVPSRLPVAR